jgi:hypothetical protein
MTCRHYQNDRCSLGLYGGKPSPGTCRQCDRYSGEMRGLGDLVERITTWTGIRRIWLRFSKSGRGGCGCSRRRDKMNTRFPFRGGRR